MPEKSRDDDSHEPTKLTLRSFASTHGQTRFDWGAWSRIISSRQVANAIIKRGQLAFEFDMSLMEYINADGLVLLLALSEYLHRQQGHFVSVLLPRDDKQLKTLAAIGFLDFEKYGLRAIGFRPTPNIPRGRMGLLRSRLMRISPHSVYGIQQDIDRRFASADFLQTLDLGLSGEARFEYATDLAIAVHELIRNIVQHSSIGRGYVGFEKVGNFALRLTIADWGIGIDQTIQSRNGVGQRNSLIDAVLHRFHYPDRPGIFTVMSTIAKWGGTFLFRSGNNELYFSSTRNDHVDDQSLAVEIERIRPKSCAYFPGVQYRIEYRIPGRPS